MPNTISHDLSEVEAEDLKKMHAELLSEIESLKDVNRGRGMTARYRGAVGDERRVAAELRKR